MKNDLLVFLGDEENCQRCGLKCLKEQTKLPPCPCCCSWIHTDCNTRESDQKGKFACEYEGKKNHRPLYCCRAHSTEEYGEGMVRCQGCKRLFHRACDDLLNKSVSHGAHVCVHLCVCSWFFCVCVVLSTHLHMHIYSTDILVNTGCMCGRVAFVGVCVGVVCVLCVYGACVDCVVCVSSVTLCTY